MNMFVKIMEVKLLTCMYDLQAGEFPGLRYEVAFIVLRGDDRAFCIIWL